MAITRIQYTGNNYDEIKAVLGDRLMAPYFCMGFSMLSVMTPDGFVNVNEGDYVVLSDDGTIKIE